MNNANFDKEIQNFFKNYHDRGMQKWGGFFLSDQIRLQLKNRNYNNEFRKDITGFVDGYHNSQIIISGYAVEIEDINHVEILRINKNEI